MEREVNRSMDPSSRTKYVSWSELVNSFHIMYGVTGIIVRVGCSWARCTVSSNLVSYVFTTYLYFVLIELHSQASRTRHAKYGKRWPKHKWLAVLPVRWRNALVGWKALRLWESR